MSQQNLTAQPKAKTPGAAPAAAAPTAAAPAPAAPAPAPAAPGPKKNVALTPYQERLTTFKQTLERMAPQLARALPEHMNPKRLMRICLTSVQKVPDLLLCTRETLFGCIVQAAQLGLEPDGMLGHAYLIPFKNKSKGVTECQLIIGYKGFLKLARQSGEVSSIEAFVVHAKDKFDVAYGMDARLLHVPAYPPIDPENGVDPDFNPGPVIGVYSVAKLKDGTTSFRFMWRHEVERIRKRSRAADSGPWVTDPEAMAMKTVVRQHVKWLPASVELAKAAAMDERVDADLDQETDIIEGIVLSETSESANDAQPAAPAATEPAQSPMDKMAADLAAKRAELEAQAKAEAAAAAPKEADPIK